MSSSRIHIIGGRQTFSAEVDQTGQFDPDTLEPLDFEADEIRILYTFRELKDLILEKTKYLEEGLRIICRGKTMMHSDDTPLASLKLKENEKLMCMGKPDPSRLVDIGFQRLLDFDKKSVCVWKKELLEIEADFGEMKKNFLVDEMREEMTKKMKKRMQYFGEKGTRLLENIDGLVIFADDTAEDQRLRNREKRKNLVCEIQNVLGHNDKLIFQVENWKNKVELEE
uniref:BAG family molecular chaperone regulator 1 n=1 Tax=Rhabditophanes sp. KR3021 TaxID=114890 RepID=A0AC35U261_9BILA